MTLLKNHHLKMYRKNHICVCICTYKRPTLLNNLLTRLEKQNTEGLFDYSIVIVDNDILQSARETVECYGLQSKLSINYYVQPEQNIALARNKAIINAKGNFVALIDDDEIPTENWILNLYKSINTYKADGVLGPVLPHFDPPPPNWVLKGQFFNRPMHKTGHILDWINTRTGNVLLKKNLFQEDNQWFDPHFASGGEDRDFFRKKIKTGHVFVWCNEAPVFEIVPPVRWNRKVMIKRALLRGKVAFENSSKKPSSLFKSTFAILIYTLSLPLFLILGHHIFMNCLVKDFDHIGKILAAVRIDIVKEKYITV